MQGFDLAGARKLDTVFAGIAAFRLTPDGKKALMLTPPETWAIQDVPPAGAPASPAAAGGPTKGKLNLDAVEVRVDPPAEWAQILHEAWRINRDYFYATNYHGADWPAIERKYEVFLPHLSSSGDLYRVVRWMLSELAVGHSGSGPGAALAEVKTVPGGLLGADYEISNGRYRFKKVFGGLNWSPEARAPLTVPGVDVKAGDYLLAVRGVDLKPPTELYSLFENTAGKSIEITVGPSPDGKGSRTVTVEPLPDEYALRNRDWVEGNLRKVHEATKGRVAYVYVPNTAGPGHTYFKRYFYPQADKEAIIVDERFNGGGQVADYYIDHLRRPFVSYWATRHGEDFKTPGASIQGPKVMLIDETAGSGGDLLPWMFRKEKLGTRRQPHLGWTRRYPRVPNFARRRPCHRAGFGDLDARRRLGCRERRRTTGRRGRAMAQGSNGRPGSATGKGDSANHGSAREVAHAKARAAGVSRAHPSLNFGISPLAVVTTQAGFASPFLASRAVTKTPTAPTNRLRKRRPLRIPWATASDLTWLPKTVEVFWESSGPSTPRWRK